MNRPIEFRAWDTKNKCWIADGEIMDLGYSVKANCFMFDNDAYDLGKDIELVQYTGLKDKNGKKIFEGDIITSCSFNYLYSNGTVDRKTSIEHNLQMGVVEWVQYNCSFMGMRRQFKGRLTDQWNNSFEMRPADERYETEVIGNIYENPELLKDTK